MDAPQLKRLRPSANTSAAIRAALDLIADERLACEQRLAATTAARAGLMVEGATAQIRDADAAIRDAQTELQQFDAMAGELRRRLTDAVATEAGAAREMQVRDAVAKIEAFNTWFATVYTEHALAIAAGVDLERQAWRAILALRDPTTNAVPEDLPPLSRAYVNRDARGLGFLTRLPSAQPGPAIVWP
jgi:Arc/MetJ-type ribon-helix-helix transcriptional regulator